MTSLLGVPDVPWDPDHEWIEVTSFGGPPEFMLGVDGREKRIALARAEYVAGHISIEEFEARVGAALGGSQAKPESATCSCSDPGDCRVGGCGSA